MVLTALFASLTTPAAQSEALVEISGTVVDRLGRPVHNAFVTDQFQYTYTDQNGRYTLEVDPSDAYVIGTSKEGFVGQARRVPLLEAADPVDFELAFRLQVTIEPRWVRPSSSTPMQIGVRSIAPSHTCAEWIDLELGHTLALELSETGRFNRWSGAFQVQPDRSDGLHWYEVKLFDCATASVWSEVERFWFITDDTGPRVESVSPAGWTSAQSPSISAHVQDQWSVVETVEVSVDHEQLAVTVRADGSISATPPSPLSEGVHDLVIKATDGTGNTTEWRGQFSVDATAPTASDSAPVGEVATRSPLLHARLADALAGLEEGSLTMTLSRGPLASRVEAAVDVATGTVSYQVPTTVVGAGLGQSPLLDGSYEVQLVGADRAGNTLSYVWSFEVRCLPPPWLEAHTAHGCAALTG